MNDEAFADMIANYSKCPYDFPYDLNQEPDNYGYFESLMTRDGQVYLAPNGHTRGLVMILSRDLNKTPEEIESIANREHDYLEWLMEQTGVLLCWYDFYTGNANEAQQSTIDYLITNKFVSRNYRRVNL